MATSSIQAYGGSAMNGGVNINDVRKLVFYFNGEHVPFAVYDPINDDDDTTVAVQKPGKFVAVTEQSWTSAEKEQARTNIGAMKMGQYTERGGVVVANLTELSWYGGMGGVLALISGGHVESCHLPPVATDVADRGKALFVKQYENGDLNELCYRLILEGCDTNAKVLEASQNGQVPCFKNVAGTFIPYLTDTSGIMHLYNVFGVSTQDPMLGDALGISLNKRVVNGSVVDDCLWGKPYGINYFEFATAKANDNLSMGSSPTKMEWRRVPIDRPLTITRIGLIGLSNTIEKDLMVGIFSYDGVNVTKVSDVTDWTQTGTTKYIHQMNDVFTLDDMIDDTSSSHYFVEFSLGSPITLERGKNYFFPCRYNSHQTYDDPYVCVYKKATPALPFEEIWRNTAQYGDPDPSTAKAGRKPTCLRVMLSDGTKMWI